MPKKPLIEFFKSRSEKVRQFLCLCDIISPQNSATGTVYSPNPEIGVLRDRNRTKSARRLIFSRSSFPASFTSTLNGPMVHCAILLDGSCSRVTRFPHLIRLGTRQLQLAYWSANEGSRNEPRIKFVVKWRGKVVLSRCHGSKLSRWQQPKTSLKKRIGLL